MSHDSTSVSRQTDVEALFRKAGVLQGQEDLNNNYLPAISSLIQGGFAVKTYFDDAPYHLAANTAWLDVNLQKKPMDDVNFRRALACSINVASDTKPGSAPPEVRYPVQMPIWSSPVSVSRCMTAIWVIPLSRALYRPATASNHPHRRGRPVVVPYS